MASTKGRKRASQKLGIQCPFCGNKTTGVEKYYSSLTTILSMRFVELLRSTNDQCCFDRVLDCIHSVFGPGNPAIRHELKNAGYLHKYEHRFGKGEDESPYKLRCYVCRELKDEWEITVDTSTGPNCEYICEDCLAKKLSKDNKSNKGECYAKA